MGPVSSSYQKKETCHSSLISLKNKANDVEFLINGGVHRKIRLSIFGFKKLFLIDIHLTTNNHLRILMI
jgi:hypothetical protein